MAPTVYVATSVPRSPSTMTMGGSAPNRTTCRTPTASAERASPPRAPGADPRATPLAIQRKLPSEMRPPARPPTAPGHPARRPAHAATGASAISIARLTRPTNSLLITLLFLGPLDHPEEFTEPGRDAHAEPDEREHGEGSQPTVQEVSADRRPRGGHHERDANGSEPPERPPGRWLVPHRAPRHRAGGYIM